MFRYVASILKIKDFATKGLVLWMAALLLSTSNNALSHAESRIKDIVYFEGVRDNMLVGYGLVVGLNGTGDNLTNSTFTASTLREHLGRLGVNTVNINNPNNPVNSLNTKNIAAVMVTATLPPFARSGNYISVAVSAMGDSKSLKGGTLLATTLVGPDGMVYAVGQGSLSIGAPSDPELVKNNKPHTTNAYIVNGAIVEREVPFKMNNMDAIRLSLKNPDITTARSIVNAINSNLRTSVASAEDPGTVRLNVPAKYRGNIVELLADVEKLYVSADQIAKVVIDKATGTVVISENVRISNVAISQGGLIVKVKPEEEFQFLLEGKQDELEESAPGTKMALMNKGQATLNDLVQGLNALGVKTTDLIAVLESIQRAGALQAAIEVR